MFSSLTPHHFLISLDLKFPFHVDDSLIFISWLNLSSDLWFIFSIVFWALLFKLSLCASTSTQNQIRFLPIMGLIYIVGTTIFPVTWTYTQHWHLHPPCPCYGFISGIYCISCFYSLFPGSGNHDCNLSPHYTLSGLFFNFLTTFSPPLSLPFYQPAHSLRVIIPNDSSNNLTCVSHLQWFHYLQSNLHIP